MQRSTSSLVLTMEEDILRQTFSDSMVTRQRVVEDDMEDLLSMPVDKALKSRRPSQSNLRTYLPTGSSSSSLAQLSRTGGVGRHSPQVATEDDLRWDQHAGYHEDDIIETLQVERSPSRLPRRASDTSLRSSTSRQSELPPLPIGPIVPISKSRSTSPTTTLLSQRGGSYSPGKGGTPLAASRIQARKGSIGSERNDYREGGPPNKRKLVDTTAGKTSFPNGGNENNKKKISPDGGTTTSRRTPSPTATTSSLGMGKAPRFPTSSPSSSLSKSKSTARPQNQSTKSDPSPKPRPRAQTQNWKTATTQQRSVSSSIISTLATNGSGSGSLGSATTRKPGIATRGGVKRVQTRQRSASTTGVTPPPKWAKDDLEVGNDPNPPWFQNDVPRVFRDGTTGELGRTGRLDELVLPAVARRLEAERLANMEESSLLISTWEKDGTPRGNLVSINSKRISPSRSESPSPDSNGLGGKENVDPTSTTTSTDPRDGEVDCQPIQEGEEREASLRPPSERPIRSPAPKENASNLTPYPPPRSSSVGKEAEEKRKGGKDDKEESHGGGCCGCTLM